MTLGPQMSAELRLPARSLQEHHELAGHRQRQRPAVVVFDQRQAQVDAGGDAGRGDDVTVGDEDRLRIDVDGRMGGRQAVAGVPVGGGPATIEAARRRPAERPRAHRGDPSGSTGETVDRGDRPLVVEAAADPFAAGHHAACRADRGSRTAGRPTIRVSPLDVDTGPVLGATSRTSYRAAAGDPRRSRKRLAIDNTSTGPVTSSDCTPGNTTTTTRTGRYGGRAHWCKHDRIAAGSNDI